MTVTPCVSGSSIPNASNSAARYCWKFFRAAVLSVTLSVGLPALQVYKFTSILRWKQDWEGIRKNERLKKLLEVSRCVLSQHFQQVENRVPALKSYRDTHNNVRKQKEPTHWNVTCIPDPILFESVRSWCIWFWSRNFWGYSLPIKCITTIGRFLKPGGTRSREDLASLCVDWKLDREGVWSPSVPFAQTLERLAYFQWYSLSDACHCVWILSHL